MAAVCLKLKKYTGLLWSTSGAPLDQQLPTGLTEGSKSWGEKCCGAPWLAGFPIVLVFLWLSNISLGHLVLPVLLHLCPSPWQWMEKQKKVWVFHLSGAYLSCLPTSQPLSPYISPSHLLGNWEKSQTVDKVLHFLSRSPLKNTFSFCYSLFIIMFWGRHACSLCWFWIILCIS